MKLILQAIKSLFRKLENRISEATSAQSKRIDEALVIANTAQTTANTAKTIAENTQEYEVRFNYINPTGALSDMHLGNVKMVSGTHSEALNKVRAGECIRASLYVKTLDTKTNGTYRAVLQAAEVYALDSSDVLAFRFHSNRAPFGGALYMLVDIRVNTSGLVGVFANAFP